LNKYFKSRFYVAMIDPQEYHSYQPLWTLVGGGQRPFKDSQRKLVEVVDKETMWHQNFVTEFNPDKNKIKMIDGTELEYKQLIVAMGLQLNWDKIPGLSQAIEVKTPNVCPNYSAFTVERTWENIQEITKKAKTSPTKLEAIFTQPSTPIKCAGAPQKIMYLAWDHWKRAGVIDNINVTFCTGMPGIFSQPDYAARLRDLCDERRISVEYENDLTELDFKNNCAVFKKGKKLYDMIHVTPPQGPLNVYKDSILANEQGWIDVNSETLQHNKYQNVWAIGDCSSLPTSKTAAAVAAQTKVLYENLTACIENKEPTTKYDGYTSCPLVTSKNECILAEFDYEFKKKESMWYNQVEPSKISYLIKARILPTLYWHLHIKGRWGGPEWLRNVFSLFKKQ